MASQNTRKSGHERYHYYILAMILVLALSLRLYGLSYQSLWLDEAHSIYHSQQSLQHIITFLDPSPPLYYGLLHFWMQIFTDSIIAVRMLSVIFGMATIIMLYLFARRIFDKSAGLYAALFSSIFPLLVYYSQEARAYSLLFLLSLISMYHYLDWIKRPRSMNMIGYVISTILLMYSHVYGILIIIVQNAYLLYLWRSRIKEAMPKIKSWLLMQSILVISFIPWIMRLPSILRLNYMVWLERPSFLQISYLIHDLFGGATLSIFGILLAILGIYIIFRYRIKNHNAVFYTTSSKSYGKAKSSEALVEPKVPAVSTIVHKVPAVSTIVHKVPAVSTIFIAPLLIIWIILPILLPVIYSMIFGPVFLPRYVYFVILPLILLMSGSISKIDKKPRIILIAAIAILSLLSLFVQQTTITKDPWNMVSSDMRSSDHDAGRIFLMSTYETLPFAYYYDNQCFRNITIIECLNSHGIYPENSLDEIRKHENNSVWLIISRGMYNNDTIYALAYFKNNYHELSHKQYLINQYSDISVALLEKVEKNYSQRYNIIDVYYFEKG